MVALRLLLSQAGRHSLSKPHSASYLAFQRCLSSSIPPPSDDSSGSEPTIQAVSYPTKSRDESNPPNETESQQPQSPPRRPPPPTTQEVRTGWTREDIRYVKDVPSISPVSYPARVAPLPEDKVELEGEEKDVKENEEMGRERRRIESQNRLLSRRSIRVAMQEEKVVVPFPMLLKAQSKKKENKPILDLMDAIKQVKATAKANFDETVEAHVRLAIPPRKTELIVRGTMNLPHGDKKAVRVAFFAEGADADDARASGADVVGGLELIEEIASSGKIDADKCFATRQLMPRLFKISKILNHQGLMPNPKQGTVTNDVARAVQEAKQGHIKFKMDNTSNVHVGLGKVSLKEELLRQNVGAFVSALLLAKPAGLKKTSKFAGYVNAFHLCSTMGPAFPISIQSLSRALDQYGKVGH